jgi:hypothetical protein
MSKAFKDETYGLDSNSEEYKAIAEKYRNAERLIQRRNECKHRMVMAILALTYPTKGLGVSKLSCLSDEKLVGIGKAARQLYKELENAGLISKGFFKENNRDF